MKAGISGPVADCGAGFAALLAGWRAGGRASPAIVMGIINVTPDSFSDGGLFADTDAAVAHGLKLAAEGAAILDIGGELTRGNAEPVSEAEEKRRVLPVVEGVRDAGALISIDTMKAAVAEAAIAAGAHIVNDVRGLQGDPELANVAARHGAGVIAMHNPGLLGSAKPLEGDPVAACLAFFERSLTIARRAGIAEDRIALDPGIGFGKSPQQNLELIARVPELASLGFPILMGTSRKSFIAKVSGKPDASRLVGTIVTNVAAALAGRPSCACTTSPSMSRRCAWPRRSALRLQGLRLDARRPRPRRQYRRQPGAHRRSARPAGGASCDQGRGGVRALRDAALGQDGPAALPECGGADRHDAFSARIAGGGARGGAAARPRSGPSAGGRARSTSTSSSSEPTRSTSRACTSRIRIFTSAPSRSPRWSTSCRTRGFSGRPRTEWLARADSAGMTRLAGPDWHRPG